MESQVKIIVPTLNEAKTISQLIQQFRSQGYHNILVIDGGSTDRTRELAQAAGAQVVIQQGKGKGAALQQAFRMISSQDQIIVTIDGDLSYLPSELDRLLRPILEEGYEHVIGNRMAYYQKGAFKKLNLIGNKLLNKLFELAYGQRLEDILSGYRAIKREALQKLELNKAGFEIEAEICVESVKKGIKTKSVPISYLPRLGRSKLKPLKDGIKIGRTIYGLAKTYNPLFYFGMFGAAFFLAGLIMGAYVALGALLGQERVILGIATAIMILLGTQLVMFGALGNLMVHFHRELLRALEKLGK